MKELGRFQPGSDLRTYSHGLMQGVAQQVSLNPNDGMEL